MLKSRLSALVTPEMSEMVRMSSRKFSGSWNGSDADRVAELAGERLQLALVDALQLGDAHAAEAVERRGHRALELLGVGARQQHAEPLERA